MKRITLFRQRRIVRQFLIFQRHGNLGCRGLDSQNLLNPRPLRVRQRLVSFQLRHADIPNRIFVIPRGFRYYFRLFVRKPRTARVIPVKFHRVRRLYHFRTVIIFRLQIGRNRYRQHALPAA